MNKTDGVFLQLPTVSVCVLCYQHANYIEKALHSIVEQITSFKFEVLVHDDASTDESAKIILDYQTKYPEMFFPIIQSENQTQQGKNILFDVLVPQAKGEYIAILEGDDFWCHPCKLQLQYDSLKNKENYVACIHKTKCVLTDGTFSGCEIPEKAFLKQSFYGDEVIKLLLVDHISVAHTSGIFFRSKVLKTATQQERSFLGSFGFVADFPLKLFLAIKGEFFYLEQALSCYRIFVKNGWTDNCVKYPQKQIDADQNFMRGLAVFNRMTDRKYAAIIQDFVSEMEYRVLFLQNEYKKMLLKKYRIFFKRESVRKQGCILIGTVFPHLATNLLRYRKR